MVQWVKCLLGKHRLKFKISSAQEKAGAVPYIGNPSTKGGWGMETGESEGSLTSQSS